MALCLCVRRVLLPVSSTIISCAYEAGQQHGLYFIIMEFIDGSSLKELMDEPIIFDLRNIYNETEIKDMGIEYYGVGK